MKQCKCGIVCFLACILAMSMLFSVPVRAAPNQRIKQLIVTGGTGVGLMQTAVDIEVLHENDMEQHQWSSDRLNPFENVLGQISDDDAEASKQCVVVWIGEEWTDDKIEGYGDWFNHDWHGRDSSSIPKTPAEYSGIALGRALAGYDYYVLEERVTNGNSMDEIPADAVHKRYEGESGVPGPVENSHMEQRSEVILENGRPKLDVNGNPMYRYWDEKVIDNYTYWVEVKVHKKGYAEYWKEKGALVYVASLGPYSKTTNDSLIEEQNASTKEFNSILSGNAKGLKFLDIFDKTLEHNPYYRDGSDHGNFYDDATYDWIFHMIWNSILIDNPEDELPEPVDHTLYALSSSLTAYMNNVLSSAADESHDDHTLSEASGDYIGNAGSFLGYGDEDYEYQDFITNKMSATSSVVDYQALVGLESNTNEMYSYARYGYLLKDMGFDSIVASTSNGAERWIPGGLMYAMYVLSSAMVVLFKGILNLLQFLNPFQFFANASNISAGMKASMTAGSVAVSSGSTNMTINGLVVNVLDVCGQMYDGFQNIGVFVIIPILLAMLLFTLLARQISGGEKWQKVKSFLLRFAFMVIGVPVMGALYTSALTSVSGMIDIRTSASTQMIASTFLDFETWVKASRLDPVDGGTFVSEPSTNQSAGSAAGMASDTTYQKLRQTCVLVNQTSGSMDAVVVGSEMQTNDRIWSSSALEVNDGQNLEATKQVLSVLQRYLTGSRYRASDWESDTLTMFTENHKRDGRDLIGRAAGPEEEDPPDTTDTLYELFDSTNETKDWTGRSAEENAKIFQGDNPYDGWDKFNVYANGRLTANRKDAGVRDTITYSSGNHSGVHSATCPCYKVGLSTLSMYNYLSTDFDSSQMVVYSNKKATSSGVKAEHYAVNLIGSGMSRVLYWANCFCIMLVVTIIGLFYGLGMLVQIVKRSFRLIASVPGAMLGVLRSVVQVIVTTICMIVEVLGTVFCFGFISQLLMIFVGAIEGPLENAVTATGLLAQIGQMLPLTPGRMQLCVGLFVLTVILLAGSVWLLKKASRWCVVYGLVSEYVILRWFVYSEVRQVYERVPQKKPIRFGRLVWQVAMLSE